jgi:hypothetical protein
MTKWGTNATCEVGQVGVSQAHLLKGDFFEVAERLEAAPQPQMAIPTHGLDSDVVS